MARGTSDNVEDDLRQERMAIQKELAELIPQVQEWYLNWVKPNVAEAKMMTVGGKRMGQDKTLTLAEADVLVLDNPTAKFEKGRAYMAHLSGRIAKLKNRENVLSERIGEHTKEMGRRQGLGRAPIRLAYRLRELTGRSTRH